MALVGITVLTRAFLVERVRGIEPPLSAWEADVLPLNYTRTPARGGRPHPTKALPERGEAAAALARAAERGRRRRGGRRPERGSPPRPSA